MSLLHMKNIALAIRLILLSLAILCFNPGAARTIEEPVPDKTDLLRNMDVFRAKFKISSKSGFLLSGEFVFKRDKGFIDDCLSASGRTKDIVNFSNNFGLTYNYSKKQVKKIDYNSIPVRDNFEPKFASFITLDAFMPFRYGVFKGDTVKVEKIEEIEGREFSVITANIAKYPFLGKRCRIWQAKDNKAIYKFIVYNDDNEPIWSLEVAEIELNPIIEDTEFEAEIASDFEKRDITEQYNEKYGVLTELYNLHDKLNKLYELKETEGKLIGNPNIIRNLPSFKSIRREPSVLIVDRRSQFIIIGLGKVDNVKDGDIFNVYRDNRLSLGKIQVIKTYEDMSVAEAITEELFRRIREGDKVAKEEEGF